MRRVFFPPSDCTKTSAGATVCNASRTLRASGMHANGPYGVLDPYWTRQCIQKKERYWDYDEEDDGAPELYTDADDSEATGGEELAEAYSQVVLPPTPALNTGPLYVVRAATSGTAATGTGAGTSTGAGTLTGAGTSTTASTTTNAAATTSGARPGPVPGAKWILKSFESDPNFRPEAGMVLTQVKLPAQSSIYLYAPDGSYEVLRNATEEERVYEVYHVRAPMGYHVHTVPQTGTLAPPVLPR